MEIFHATDLVPKTELSPAERRKPEEAEKELERSIELDSKYARAWFYLGRARKAEGNQSGAQSAYDRAHSLDAQFEESQEPKQ